jgi:pyruvate ferredoxin oxidoreductase alpha subunit
MTLGNRAIGSPINIWNDHSDAMTARDSGWIMLFAETNQEALDLHIQAFRIAEKMELPVMICVDGFILTHAYEPVDIPSQEEVDEFLPPYNPSVRLNIANPLAIGTMVSPEYFMEVRYLAHQKQIDAIGTIRCVGEKFSKKFGRNSGGLLREYDTADAETIIVTLGSVAGTIKDVIDDLNLQKEKYGVISIVSYRPFPANALRNSLKKAKRVIVLEKAFAIGIGGILFQEIELILKDTDIDVFSVIAGIGGRNITKPLLFEYFSNKNCEKITFLGLKKEIIAQEYGTANCSGCEGDT